MKINLLILVFLLIFTISFDAFCQENNNCQEDDYEALRALYLSTDGDNWDDNTGWLTAAEFIANPTIPTGTYVSTWHGVTIDSNACVLTLNLVNNGLNGIIPLELGNLTNLISLRLGVNQLTGNIPSELGNLTNLTSLALSANQLTGNIPSELGNLTNLTSLALSANQLTGNIPPELGNLSNLSFALELSYNQLTGNIPSQLGNLNNLLYLSMQHNQLTGAIPPEIGNLSSLKYCYLEHNQFTGNLPPQFGDLTNLEELYLNHNQFTGSIPAEFGNFNRLEYLDISNNQLSGCYDIAIMPLCGQLVLSGLDGSIDSGNNFDVPWADFCIDGAGTCTVDIDNTHQSTFTVYPVPTKDVVVFDVPNIAVADDIILYDITGKQISRQAFPQDKQLAVSHLNDGVYVYRIFYEEEVYSGKIVVE